MNQISDTREPADTGMIPGKYHVFSGSLLKCLAMICMLIDHTAVVLISRSTIVLFHWGGSSVTLYAMMRKIGRLAFPIFAFLLVEGFLHTRNRKRYGISLLLFALISEIPWNLEHTGTIFYEKQNVFFTLFLGYMGLCAYEYFQGQICRQVLSVFSLYLLTMFMKSDYGLTGFGFIILMYAVREQKLLRAVLGCCFLSSTWVGGLAFIPISLYNGKRGFIRSPILKYAFYAFYPVHILVLYYIKLRTAGYP